MENKLNITWLTKPFVELTVDELYAILQLRSAIFVVEQNCVFQDMDGKDQQAYHCMGWLDNRLVAYSRLFDKKVTYEQASIGRVIVASEIRKFGIGKQLMQVAISESERLFGSQAIKIGAQFYLRRFYESLGFRQISEIYMEDNIPHVYMEKS
ncbi:MAG: GNAT family N-acetyltransferase [Thermoflexibacter sp.]|jgi:ElaA protein|nr:GNAT family N-acetyltransferase [Thermoflexibacter sp.]